MFNTKFHWLIIIISSPFFVFAHNIHPEWLAKEFAYIDKLDIQDPHQALAYTQKLSNKKNLSLTYYDLAAIQARIAKYAFYIGKNDLSKHANEQAKSLYADEKGVVGFDILANNANLMSMVGQNTLARKLISKAIKIALQEKNNELLSKGYTIIATFYSSDELETLAIKYYQRAYEIIQKKGDEFEIANLHANMAISYTNIKDYPKAIEFLELAIGYYSKHGLLFDEQIARYNIADIYLKMRDFAQAESNYKKILVSAAKSKDVRNQYFAYTGLAKVYLAQDELNLAERYIALAEPLLADIQSAIYKMSFFYTQLRIHLKQNKLNKAKEGLDYITQLTDEMHKTSYQLNRVTLLSLSAEYYALSGDYQKAYDLLIEKTTLLDEIKDRDREEVRSKYKIQFDTQQSELKNELLLKDIQIKQLALEKSAKETKFQNLVIGIFAILALLLLYLLIKQFQVKKRLHLMANTDSLTQLHNRRYLFFQIDKLFNKAKKQQSNLAVIAFDIDHFKKINDNYGHAVGDLVLVEISRISQDCLRDIDILARIGGEEFLAVLVDLDIKKAIQIAQRLRSAIEKLDIIHEESIIKVTASFGVAKLNPSTEKFADLLQNADDSLYAAKSAGRNRVKVFKS